MQVFWLLWGFQLTAELHDDVQNFTFLKGAQKVRITEWQRGNTVTLHNFCTKQTQCNLAIDSLKVKINMTAVIFYFEGWLFFLSFFLWSGNWQHDSRLREHSIRSTMKTAAAVRGNQAGGFELFCLMSKKKNRAKLQIKWTDFFFLFSYSHQFLLVLEAQEVPW